MIREMSRLGGSTGSSFFVVVLWVTLGECAKSSVATA